MSDEDLRAELEQLRKENAALKKESASGTRLRVSEKFNLRTGAFSCDLI